MVRWTAGENKCRRPTIGMVHSTPDVCFARVLDGHYPHAEALYETDNLASGSCFHVYILYLLSKPCQVVD
jgi:hypothetical protein